MMEPHILALDPWYGDFENFDISEPSPVRTIPITPALRAIDAADRAKREASTSTWAFKSQLSIENLRRDTRPAPLPGRRHDVRRFEVEPAKRFHVAKTPGPRFCIDCPSALTIRQIKRCSMCSTKARLERYRVRNAARAEKNRLARSITPEMISNAFGTCRPKDAQSLMLEDRNGSTLWASPKRLYSTNGNPKEREALKGSK